MKIATRIDADLTNAIWCIELDAGREQRREVQEVRLRAGRAYDVLAVELSTGRAGPNFWVIGEGFASGAADGLVYPDLIAADECRVVDDAIPPGWVMRVNHVAGGTHTILGAPALVDAGFLEKLTNGEDAVVKLFLSHVFAGETGPLHEFGAQHK